MATPKPRQHKKASGRARRLQKKMKRLKLSAEEEKIFTEFIKRAAKKNKLKTHCKITTTFGEKQKNSIHNDPTPNRASKAPAEKLAIEHKTSLKVL